MCLVSTDTQGGSFTTAARPTRRRFLSNGKITAGDRWHLLAGSREFQSVVSLMDNEATNRCC